MIADPHRIARETEHIAQAQGVGTEQVRLQGDAIAIPTSQLQNGLKPLVEQQPAHGQAAHPHHGAAAIRDIDRMHPALQAASRRQRAGWIAPSGRRDLGRDCGSPAGQCSLKQQIRLPWAIWATIMHATACLHFGAGVVDQRYLSSQLRFGPLLTFQMIPSWWATTTRSRHDQAGPTPHQNALQPGP